MVHSLMILSFMFTPYFGYASFFYMILFFLPLTLGASVLKLLPSRHVNTHCSIFLKTMLSKQFLRTARQGWSPRKLNWERPMTYPSSTESRGLCRSGRNTKESGSIHCRSKKRNHALDHVLLSGPPGLETTLANIFAKEIGFRSGPHRVL